MTTDNKGFENQLADGKLSLDGSWDSIFNPDDLASQDFSLDDEDRHWLNQEPIGREILE